MAEGQIATPQGQTESEQNKRQRQQGHLSASRQKKGRKGEKDGVGEHHGGEEEKVVILIKRMIDGLTLIGDARGGRERSKLC